jgi:hypothetical protein
LMVTLPVPFGMRLTPTFAAPVPFDFAAMSMLEAVVESSPHWPLLVSVKERNQRTVCALVPARKEKTLLSGAKTEATPESRHSPTPVAEPKLYVGAEADPSGPLSVFPVTVWVLESRTSVPEAFGAVSVRNVVSDWTLMRNSPNVAPSMNEGPIVA